MWLAATRGAVGKRGGESPKWFWCKFLEKERTSGMGPGVVSIPNHGRLLPVSPSRWVSSSGFCSQISDLGLLGFFLGLLHFFNFLKPVQNVEVKSCLAWWPLVEPNRRAQRRPSGEAHFGTQRGGSGIAWESHDAFHGPAGKKNLPFFGCGEKQRDVSSGTLHAVPSLSCPAKQLLSPAVLLPHSSVGQVFMEVSPLTPWCRCRSIRRCLHRCQAPRRAQNDLAKLVTSPVDRRPQRRWRCPGASNICRRLADVSRRQGAAGRAKRVPAASWRVLGTLCGTSTDPGGSGDIPVQGGLAWR